MEFQTCVFLTVLTASLFMLVDASYQLEIDLRSYSNPSRRVWDPNTGGNGACCDTTDPRDGLCIPQDTCDVIFNIRARNFRRGNIVLGSAVQLGTFEDSDSITFMNYSLITGGRNPLIITFPASSYSPSAREQIRLNIEISDEDILNTGGRSLTRIQNFVFEIPRSQPSSTAFSSLQTLESPHTPPLRLTFRFRLACTCEDFCTCPPGFTGIRCSIQVTTPLLTQPSTPPPTMTVWTLPPSNQTAAPATTDEIMATSHDQSKNTCGRNITIAVVVTFFLTIILSTIIHLLIFYIIKKKNQNVEHIYETATEMDAENINMVTCEAYEKVQPSRHS